MSENLMSNAAEEVLSIARDLVELDARIVSIREDRNEVKARLKALGIKATDFNYAYRIFKLEAEDQVTSVEGMRLCLQSLLPDRFSDLVNQGELFAPKDVRNQ
jgi:hypothetical protein